MLQLDTSGLVILKWSLEEGRDAEQLLYDSGSTEQDRQLASFLKRKEEGTSAMNRKYKTIG